MKDTKKGVLHLILVVIAIAVLGYIAAIGIGKGHRGSTGNIRLGLDLAGGVSVTYESVKNNPTAEQIADTINTLSQRAENISTEAEVYKEGSRRINVDIPGVKDANRVLKDLGQVGKLEFKDESGKKLLDGSDVKTAKAEMRTEGTKTEYVINLEFTPSGANKFADATTANLNKKLYIYYDGKVLSAPNVKVAITDGKAEITGQESYESAEHIASVIRSGALPLELKEIHSNVVGAKLGLEAIDTSLLAGIIGFILIILFMIAVYRIPGVAASIALIFYVGAMSFILNIFDITLTLPGIAGILLSIGMAVDANVIIFTRIKEELAAQRGVATAVKNGFDKALSAIVDGNVTTLIAALVLLNMGSGTIKGFAKTLMIGIILSMFTALFVTKFVLHAFVNLGIENVKFFGVAKEAKTKSFVKNFAKFASVSVIIILIGIGSLIYNRTSDMGTILNYGLDFKGGTSTAVTFNEDTVAGDKKQEVVTLVKDTVGQTPEISEIEGENTLTIKTTELSLDERSKLSNAFIDKYGVDEEKITAETISASVSDEMKSDAVIAVVVATICMLIYIAFRFKDILFGTSAVLALLHDVLIVLTVYAVGSTLGKISVGNTFIACMLTIVGYSINATIVTFDRIRENRKEMKKAELEEVVNASVSQTVVRNINTSLTTFIMVFVLFILGVDSIKEFTLPLMAGIIGGAYSSTCITGSLWYVLRKMFHKKKAA